MNAPRTRAEIIASCDVSALTNSLRAELLKNVGEIPEDLKSLKAWLLWKVTEINPPTGKFNKIPFYPGSRDKRRGVQGEAADLANLGTWDEAMTAFNSDRLFAGVGIGVLPC